MNPRFACAVILFLGPFFIKPGRERRSGIGGIIGGGKQIKRRPFWICQIGSIGCSQIGHLILNNKGGQRIRVDNMPSKHGCNSESLKMFILGMDFRNPVTIIILIQFDLLTVNAALIIDIANGFCNPQSIVLADIGSSPAQIIKRTDSDMLSSCWGRNTDEYEHCQKNNDQFRVHGYHHKEGSAFL